MIVVYDQEARFQSLLQKLRQRQYRLTPQRLALLRLLISRQDHPRAGDLYDEIRTQFPTMSLATVYKTLDLLKEMGEVLELGFGDDGNRYDGSRPFPHAHLICVRCRTILDPDLEATERLIRDVTQVSGFRIVGHRVDLYGICPDCQRKEQD